MEEILRALVESLGDLVSILAHRRGQSRLNVEAEDEVGVNGVCSVDSDPIESRNRPFSLN